MKIMKGVMMLILASAHAAAQDSPSMRISLALAESLALHSSTALRLGELEVRAAEERFRLEARGWLPQLEVAVASQSTVNRFAPDSSGDELRLTLEQPIYNGGRSVAQRALARLELELGRHSLRAARAAALSTVRDQFFQVVALKAQLAVRSDYLDQGRRELQIVAIEEGVGIARALELLDSELQVSGLELERQATESRLSAAAFALKESLGLPPDCEIELDGSMDPFYEGIPIGASPALLSRVAEAGNLELETARHAVAAATTQAALARSRHLPRLSASLSFTLSGEHLPLTTPGFSIGFTVAFPQPEAPAEATIIQGFSGSDSRSRTASLTLNPLQSFSGIADETDALLALERARADLASLRRTVGFQLAGGIIDHRRQQETVLLERRAIGLERRKLAVMRMELERGLATRVELLKEELLASDLEARHLESVLTLMRGEWALERLIGLDPGQLARVASGPAALRGAAKGSPPEEGSGGR